jgi:hypothetical protein
VVKRKFSAIINDVSEEIREENSVDACDADRNAIRAVSNRRLSSSKANTTAAAATAATRTDGEHFGEPIDGKRGTIDDTYMADRKRH